MKKTIQVKYSFAEDAEIVDRNSQEIQEYMKVFKTEVIPEMEEIERRKTRAIEHAYKIRVCSTDYADYAHGGVKSLSLTNR